MVFRKDESFPIPLLQSPSQLAWQVQFLLQPERHGFEEGRESLRGVSQISLQQPLELQQRLVVEADIRKIVRSDSLRIKTILYRVARKVRIMLLARESFLLRSRHNLSVLEQARGAVVVIGRDAENPCRTVLCAHVRTCRNQERFLLPSELIP